jgi:hypothetical protein
VNPYGFDWGPMHVERMAHIEGPRLRAEDPTAHDEIQVYVSEGGCKARPYPDQDLAVSRGRERNPEVRRVERGHR